MTQMCRLPESETTTRVSRKGLWLSGSFLVKSLFQSMSMLSYSRSLPPDYQRRPSPQTYDLRSRISLWRTRASISQGESSSSWGLPCMRKYCGTASDSVRPANRLLNRPSLGGSCRERSLIQADGQQQRQILVDIMVPSTLSFSNFSNGFGFRRRLLRPHAPHSRRKSSNVRSTFKKRTRGTVPDGSLCDCPSNAKSRPLGIRVIAFRMLTRLENRFETHPALRTAYMSFLREYLELGHMRPMEPTESSPSLDFFLPHHGVIRESELHHEIKSRF